MHAYFENKIKQMKHKCTKKKTKLSSICNKDILATVTLP